MNHLIRFPFFLITLFVALLLSACSLSLAEDLTPPPGAEQMPLARSQPTAISGPLYPLVAPNPQDGKAIYAEKCAPCHGQSGLGDGPRAAQLPNPVTAIGSFEVARQATPSRWYTQVTQGNLEKFMPPFASLSDRERWDVVAYAFSLSMPATLVEQGEQLYRENCARCHGESGKGDGPDASALSKPVTDLTDQSLMAQKSAADFFQAISQGISPDMPAFAEKLSEDERWALAAYLRTLTFTSVPAPVAEMGTPAPIQSTEVTTTSVPTATLATPGAEASANVGKVTGKVFAPASVKLPPDLSLTLRGFDNMSMVTTQTTTLQEDGSFVFEAVPMPPGRVFLVTTEFQNTTYTSDIAIAQSGSDTLDLPIHIFETTTDASVLKADRLHLFFEFLDNKTVQVVELYIISNPTDKTLVATEPGGPVVHFTLPKGASNLQFQDGELGGRYVQTPEGFADTISVQPGSGSYEVLYAYQMPYDGKLELAHPVTMPVEAIVILVPEGSIKVKGEKVQDTGTRDVENVKYHTYTGGGLAAGEMLRLTLSGRPRLSTPSLVASSSTSLIIGLTVFGVALILAGVWLYRRSRLAEGEIEDDSLSIIAPAQESAEALMDAIIALDDLYQDGQLPEEAYRQRRAELKARLKEILEQNR